MKSPAFQFYPSDWLSSRAVRLMDAEQRGWYIQLLAEAWESSPQATLPNDPPLLIRLADARTDSVDFQTRWDFVISQFKTKNSMLINARLAHEKKKQTSYHEQRKQAGAKGAKNRWSKPVDAQRDTAEVGHSSAIDKPPPTYDSANGKPVAKDSLSSSSSISSSTATSTSVEEKRERHAKPRDERTDHPAIKAVHEIRGRYPHKDVWDLIIKTLGETPDVEKLRTCWVVWRSKNFAPDNLGWLVDWYVNGITANGHGAMSKSEQSLAAARRVAAEYER